MIKKSSEWRVQWEYISTGDYWFYVADGRLGWARIKRVYFEGSAYSQTIEESFDLTLPALMKKAEDIGISYDRRVELAKILLEWQGQYFGGGLKV